MCGICGIASRDGFNVPVSEDALRSMTDVIEHRGPDDDGHHLAPGVALGMRRLSIIDVPGGHQPLANEDASVWTVFNGEIYNFPELRKGLAARGHRLASSGDTETIVHLYEEHGIDFPRHLRGMFGIAVWDEPRRRLVLARDRMGVKPLYYAQGAYGLAFASEVKSLIAGGLIEPRLDPVAAELFMAYGYVPGPRTLFEGVSKLPAASVLVWEDGRITRESEYWDAWQDPPARRGTSWAEDQEQLLDLLRTAVRARMISEVPLGVMLSGGLDSSLVTALMAEASTGPVKTFSIGFAEDAGANELDDAARVAARLGTDHHPILTSAVDHPELLDHSLWHLEEPVNDLSTLGFLLLSRLARQHVTVALSGQGADELLGGYTKHAAAWAAGGVARTPAPLRSAAEALVARRGSEGKLARGVVATTTGDPVRRLLAMSRVMTAKERESLFRTGVPSAQAAAEIEGAVRGRLDARAGDSVLSEVLHLDRKLALVDKLFLYFDKMSMAPSLEVRVPFMDHDVVTFCVGLPDDRKVFRGRRKELLKRASRGLVDDAIIDKRKRAFLVSAMGTWLRVHRETVFRETLLDERTRERGLFPHEPLADLLASAAEPKTGAHRLLLPMLLLEKWHRCFVDSDGPGGRAAAQAAAVTR